MNRIDYPITLAAVVPAEVKKYRFDEPTIQKLLSKQWWNGSAEELKKVKEMEFRVGSISPINSLR